MKKMLVGILGIALFLVAILLHFSDKNGEALAIKLDDEKKSYGMIGDDVAPPCSWEATPPERVVSENKSTSVTVAVSNTMDVGCESSISLRAPNFDLSPSKEEQKISLTSGSKGSLSWIITPRKTGTFEIAVSDILNSKIFGISVTNVFGLSSMQAKLFSGLGSIFGPMLTVPWWWDRLRGKKQKQEGQKDGSDMKGAA